MHSYGRQHITAEDIDAVVETLKSDFLTQGPAVKRFENAIANYGQAKYAVATNSATSALHVACLALGLARGDTLWTSPITFVASANCALYCGAQVDFIDIDPKTLNLCPKKLEQKLKIAEREGNIPKIVVAVHFAGQPCDLQSIHRLAQHYGFSVIEDAAHAIGALYQGRPIGSCQYSDITIFSFHPVKIITSAEGGMAVTNNPDLLRRMQLFSSHCVTRDPGEMENQPDGDWYYEQAGLGYNYRMTDLQAALGLSQLDRLDSYVATRNRLANYYQERFSNTSVLTQFVAPACYSSYHLFVVRVPLEETTRTKAIIYRDLKSRGIGVNLHYMPVYLQPFYTSLGFEAGYCPEAEKYYSEALTLPLHPQLTQKDLTTITESLQEALYL